MPQHGTDVMIQLHQILGQRFNDQELRTLCFYLQVRFEDLGGDTQEARARELIAHLGRRGRLAGLVQAGVQLRDDIDWPVVPETAEQPAFQVSEAVHQELAVPHTVLNELGLGFPEKRFRIGATQARILDYIVQGYALHGAVTQEMIHKTFPKIPGAELYYRLEQLRLLGFIEKEKIGVRGDKPAYTYRVSAEYQAARGM